MHRAEAPGPTSLTRGHASSSRRPFSMCLLGEHELGVGAWEGGMPGFPQAGG